jgi:ribosomal protein S18 acetylase RimI-like enzyme
LANLIHFETRVHRHLDWRSPLDWIEQNPFLVAERGKELLAALVCPQDPPGVAWIRLFALAGEVDLHETWTGLWDEARNLLVDMAGDRVVVIPLQSWFVEVLETSGFIHTHDIMILMWTGKVVEAPADHSVVTIRSMEYSDLNSVYEVDLSAFGPVWQIPLVSLDAAFTQSAISTVAIHSGCIVGYQISTSGEVGGHIARLAVHPDQQGKHIGYALVKDVLKQFTHRGVSHVTVKTQHNNVASLHLYEKIGFRRTGDFYKVYEFLL